MGRAENTFGKQDTHCTPPEVYEPILEALRIDRFGLDPFGNPGSAVPADTAIVLPTHKVWPEPAEGYLQNVYNRIWGDAYDFDWSGRGAVFCNGPTSDCKPWAEQGYGDRGGDENVSLWPVRTGAHWWQDFVAPADVIMFYRGRLTFVGSTTQAPWHNALSYIGPRGDLFAEGMKKYGWTVRNQRDWS